MRALRACAPGALLFAALALALAAPAPSALRVAFLSDLEGSARKLSAFLHAHPAFVRGAEGRPHLAPGWRFVHGGDVPDRFAGSIEVAEELVRLKDEAPDRVTLIAGNRDLNKIRLLSELSPGGLRSPAPVRHGDWQKWLGGRQPTRAGRLRWILARTMGAPDAFELRRRELAGRGRPAGDEDVAASYLAELRAGGAFRALLERSQLLARIGSTLFCHAGLTDENVGFVPGQAARAPTVDAWIARLDRWYRAQLEAWERGAEAWDGRMPRPGEELIRYAEPVAFGVPNASSVVYSRNVDEQGKIALPSAHVIRWLSRGGIRRLALGHTPSGDTPVLLRTEDDAFELLVVDSSHASDPEAPSLVTLDGPDLDAVSVRSRIALAGARREVAFCARLDSPSRLGRRLADGSLLVAPLPDGFASYQLRPGWKVVYQLHRDEPVESPGLRLSSKSPWNRSAPR